MGSSCEILYDGRWRGASGIARFATEVRARLTGLTDLDSAPPLFHPVDPIWLTYRLARHRPALYLSPGFNPPWRTSTPFVFTVHDLNYIYCRQNSDFGRRQYFQWLVRPACKRAARVLTVSEYSRRCLLDWSGVSPDRVVNVGAGVGPEFAPNGQRHQPGFPYVLFVGNRLRHKNLPLLLRAMRQARNDCVLLMTGTPADDLVSLAGELGLERRLKFAGNVSNAELPALYRGAEALVLPSLYEGFGLPVVEAMACGTPVLTSNVTSLPEVAGDAAMLVDPTSEDSVAYGLQTVVADTELRARLRARGLERAKHFSWERTASAVRAVTESIVER